MASFESVRAKHFPGSLREEDFVDESTRLLTQEQGFSPDNTLACVGVCRDEICHTLTYAVQALWGWPFGFSVLAGIQVHGPGNEPWFWPGACYSMVQGQRQEISFG
jgi:hypothetical protein